MLTHGAKKMHRQELHQAPPPRGAPTGRRQYANGKDDSTIYVPGPHQLEERDRRLPQRRPVLRYLPERTMSKVRRKYFGPHSGSRIQAIRFIIRHTDRGTSMSMQDACVSVQDARVSVEECLFPSHFHHQCSSTSLHGLLPPTPGTGRASYA
jgi:hypothetical protein